MKKVILIKSCLMLICLLLTVSCSMGIFIKPSIHETQEIITPQIGEISKCNLGELIIMSSQGYYADGINIKSNAEVSLPLTPSPIKINAGFYELVFTDENNNKYYYPSKKGLAVDYMAEGYGYLIELMISANGKISVIRENGEMWSSDELSKVTFDVVKSYFVLKEDSFQQSLIYVGKEKDIIKFSYREFYQDRIRDAFTTEISYDLSESKFIGYKKFEAEIIEATNSRITYKIVSGF